MKILLDENFPLPLYRRLREAGYDAEHVITLGKRGMPDAELRRRLAAEPILLLTNDTEFEDIGLDYAGKVIISRLPQRLPIAERWKSGSRLFSPSWNASRRTSCSTCCPTDRSLPGKSANSGAFAQVRPARAEIRARA